MTQESRIEVFLNNIESMDIDTLKQIDVTSLIKMKLI